MSDDLNNKTLDLLRDVSNTGCIRATAVLSQLAAADFTTVVPRIAVAGYGSLPELIGAAEEETVSIMLQVSGGLDGVFLLLLCPHTALRVLASLSVEAPESFRNLPQSDRSALLEMGDIICGSYMSAVSEMTGVKIGRSVPALAADMLGAILNAPVIRFAETGSSVLCIQNEFFLGERAGSFLFLLDPESVKAFGEGGGDPI